jgi:hypothetical protein
MDTDDSAYLAGFQAWVILAYRGGRALAIITVFGPDTLPKALILGLFVIWHIVC